jgi:hypothetical protein
MTDISTTAPSTIRRPNLPMLRFPGLEIGASLAALPGLVSDALKMACVTPYASPRRQPQIVPEDDPEARDPAW